MSEATTPANPTDQIAAVVATPAVVPDAQRYDWREDLDMATDYGSTMSLDAAARVAADFERLEAEMEDALAYVARVEATNEKVIAERDALLEGAPAALRRSNQHYRNNRDNWKARALNAEAMCKWLAEEVAMGRHDTVDNVLDAAREAVANER